jgi:ribosome maturation factor RimP
MRVGLGPAFFVIRHGTNAPVGAGGRMAGMTATSTERRVARLIEASVEALGFELVRVKLYGGGRPTLQIMIEPVGGGAVSIDDCASVSRTVSAVLDVDDPIAGAYALEVSSPGLDRPLTRLRDFDRFAGFEARVELEQPDESGRRRFRGRVMGLDEAERVRLRIEDGSDVALPFADIRAAKLVLTDELIAAAATGPQ